MNHSFCRLLALGCALALLAGCGRKPTNAALAKVTTGMGPVQAKEVLGPPTLQEELPLGEQKAERWVYGEEPNQVELVFLRGKLISKSGEFVEKP